MPLVKIPFNVTGDDRLDLKKQAVDVVRSRGVNTKPDTPRDLIAQSGSRKVIVTWVAPADQTGIVGYRVKSPTDVILVAEIRDPTCRRVEVAAPSGATPTPVNVFVYAINAQGIESSPGVTQGKALVEAGAPVDPPAPPGWSGNPSGGGSNPFQCFAPGTMIHTTHGIISNEELYRLWSHGESISLIGRDGPEFIETAEWVTSAGYIGFQVEEYGWFYGSPSTTVLERESGQYVHISDLLEGMELDTDTGWKTTLRVKHSKIPCAVLCIHMRGPSHQYKVGDGLWTHNMKADPLNNNII